MSSAINGMSPARMACGHHGGDDMWQARARGGGLGAGLALARFRSIWSVACEACISTPCSRAVEVQLVQLKGGWTKKRQRMCTERWMRRGQACTGVRIACPDEASARAVSMCCSFSWVRRAWHGPRTPHVIAHMLLCCTLLYTGQVSVCAASCCKTLYHSSMAPKLLECSTGQCATCVEPILESGCLLWSCDVSYVIPQLALRVRVNDDTLCLQ